MTKVGKKRIVETHENFSMVWKRLHRMCNPSKIKVRYIGNLVTNDFIKEKIYDVILVERGWYKIKTELEEEHYFPPELFEELSLQSEKMPNNSIKIEDRLEFIDDSVDIGKEALIIQDENLKKELDDLLKEFR